VSIIVALLLAALAGCGTSGAHDSRQLVVYLKSDVTDAQRTAVNDKLVAMPTVKDIVFVSKEDAYAQLKDEFRTTRTYCKTSRPTLCPSRTRRPSPTARWPSRSRRCSPR
jgi:cell division protein FtsX